LKKIIEIGCKKVIRTILL